MEAALALGTLLLVTAAAVAAVAAVGAGVRCADAAREFVRQAARGDAERGRAAVAALAPSGAEAELRIDGDTVLASVRARPVPLLPVTVGASATAVLEPGAGAHRSPAPVDAATPDPGARAAIGDDPLDPTGVGAPGASEPPGPAGPGPELGLGSGDIGSGDIGSGDIGGGDLGGGDLGRAAGGIGGGGSDAPGTTGGGPPDVAAPTGGGPLDAAGPSGARFAEPEQPR
ncbi:MULTISPECIES: TadE family type IV pilus minor pilin [Pseudonocardia]|uniref:TadE-like protein n=2 Tax=Pseudonocardia TaxID=1847 RepID=A0A1Y2MW85_PSEAH|nr:MULTISPECIES: TadE family type IV pilus minor pilin [Pseudonocardia]OSY39454.1 hypothetical protein BG845_03399 [Pseudonocardia autotrophica]TDN75308.1 hypothetical protein C8E95_4458 [Pseudonocardia autotrophica]BBF99254.1 hypothetical protein Pdca_04640 [Pseudonocardia autotrophica]GEC24800.1 hypothetical protein PSA01_18290 [Pseudonocardia saturnea]